MAEGLRERKKQRTREQIIEAAMSLFAERGYHATTIADIAEAADVSRATFFSYFRSKDDVLFFETDRRIELLGEFLGGHRPEEPPLVVLRRVLTEIMESAASNLVGESSGPRLRILLANPELQARGLQRIFAAEGQIATQLRAAYPEIDELTATAFAGALVGALRAVAMRSLERGDPPDVLKAAMERTLAQVGSGFAVLQGQDEA